ncbi:MAG: hypothetical protein ACJ8GN_24320 [Longimicrobiaceae bacterium]
MRQRCPPPHLRSTIPLHPPDRPPRHRLATPLPDPLRARSSAPAGARAGTALRRALAPLACAAALSCARGDAAAPADGALAALAAARVPRPFAARLSVETRWRPCTAAPSVPGSAVPAEACGPAGTPSARVLAAAERASAAAGAGVDPAALHAAGVIDLLWPREGGNSLGGALSLLERAARLSERPAPVLADLAAGRLARAERTGSVRDLLRRTRPPVRTL